MQEPCIVDWRLSPGSFAITPRLQVGDDGCERFTPANIALNTYFFYKVILNSSRIQLPATGLPDIIPASDQALLVPGSIFTGTQTTPASGINQAGNELLENTMDIPIFKLPPVQKVSHATGSIFVYRSDWYQLGHSLGKVLYSLALAPGETTNIAIIDWMRESVAARTEATTIGEQLIADLRRDRSIDETIQGAVNEYQHGNSFMGAGSLVGGAAASGGSVGGMLGAWYFPRWRKCQYLW